MFEKIDSFLDKVRNISAKLQNISKTLRYGVSLLDHLADSLARLPRFSDDQEKRG